MNEILERFGQTTGPQIYQLKKALDNLRQQNLTVMIYYSKMKHLWDALKVLRQFPSCDCGALTKCSCNFLKRLANFENEEKVMQFLLGLNSGFDSTISNILTIDQIPSVNKALFFLQQVETQRELSGHADINTEISALAAQRFVKPPYEDPHVASSNHSPNGGVNPYSNDARKDWKKEKMSRFFVTFARLKAIPWISVSR